MKTVLRFFITTTAGIAAFASFAIADNHGGSMHSVSGHLRTRMEYTDNAALADSNWSEMFLNRARINFDISPSDSLKVRLTPEVTHTWGSLDTARPNFAAYEAWMAWMPNDSVTLYLGRQAVTFASGRFIGIEDWAQTGPTHDNARLVFNHEMGESHFFWAKQNERQGAGTSLTDNNLFVLYNALDMSDRTEMLSGLDLYLAYLWDADVGGVAGVSTKYFVIGARFDGDVEMVDYELEATTQFGEVAGVDSQKGLMLDLNVGADFMERHRLGLNAVYANSEYRNVYGDTHQFLGSTDTLSRNNLYALGVLGDFGLNDEFSAGIDLWYAMRASTDSGYTTLTGVAAAGTDRPLGMEVDFSLSYKPEEMLAFDAGYGFFKAQGGLDDAVASSKVFHDFYLQGTMSF